MMAKRNGPKASAGLYEFRDTDLMHKVQAEGGADGLTAVELADSLGLTGETAANAIGIRCAWMRRFGFFDYDEKRKLWRLSNSGDRVIESHVKASTISAMEAVPDEAMVEVMAHVVSRYRHADSVTANLLRREFAVGTHERRLQARGLR